MHLVSKFDSNDSFYKKILRDAYICHGVFCPLKCPKNRPNMYHIENGKNS